MPANEITVSETTTFIETATFPTIITKIIEITAEVTSEPLITASAMEEINMYKNIKYDTYTNARFGCSIEYPSFFQRNPPPANGDGLSFSCSDGAYFSLSGMNNALSHSLDEEYAFITKSIDVPIAYSAKKDNWFVVSYIENNNIIYEKVFVGKTAINEFYIKYPKNLKSEYDGIITYIVKSFKHGKID